MNSHLKLYKKSKFKVVTLLLVIIASILDFFGVGLIAPFMALMFDLEITDNQIIDYLNSCIDYLGIPNTKLFLALYIIIIIFTKAGILILFRYIVSISALSYLVSLRQEIYFGLFNSKFGFASDKTSNILNALTVQSEEASGVMNTQLVIIQKFITLSALFVFGILFSWKISLLALIIGLAVFGFLRFTVSWTKKISSRLVGIKEKYFGVIDQSLLNYRYLKSISGFDRLYHDLHPLLNDIFKYQNRFVLLNRGTGLITEPIILACLAFVLLFGVNYLQVNVATIVVLYVILIRFYGTLLGSIKMLQGYSRSLISVEYCWELLSSLVKEKEINGTKKWDNNYKEILIEDISFSYKKEMLLKNINLKIKKNKVTIIYGKSGSGKSTLLNIIMGLIKPNKGNVLFVGGEKIEKYDIESFRRNIGLVTQDSAIFNLSVRDNLSIRNTKVSDSEMIQLIKQFNLETLFPDNQIDLSYKIDETSSNLSGGEKQRLALIRELLLNPDILILDEVSSSLDKENVDRIINFLNEIRNTMTIIIVTHQKEYLRIADNSYEIDSGKILPKPS